MAAENINKQLNLYIITRFTSQANRRNVHLLQLAPPAARTMLVHQVGGSTYHNHQDDIHITPLPRISGILKRLGLIKLEHIFDQLLYFPSPIVLYTQSAQRVLGRRIRGDLAKNHRVCLITCLPPHELCLIGLHLKQKFPSIRWIVDWQDLWSYDDNYFGALSVEKKNWVRHIERQVFDMCDLNVVTNPLASNILVQEYSVVPQKIQVIYHAFDPGDWDGGFALSSMTTHASPIKIGILGNLFKPPKVPGDQIIAALDRARGDDLEIEFHIIGDKYLEQVSRKPIEGFDWVKAWNRTSHEESLRIAANCDFLLLALADLPVSRTILHAKMPYYLLLGKPIIAIVPQPSAVSKVIQETNSGIIVRSDQDWVEGLRRVLLAYKATGNVPTRDLGAIQRYSLETFTKEWLVAIEAFS